MVLSDAKVVLLEVNSLAVTLKCQPGCDQIRVIMTHTCDRGALHGPGRGENTPLFHI